MRRKDREITDPGVIEEIVRKARIVHLGMMDGEYPYVVPLHYGVVLEKGVLTLYLHSAKEGRKLDLLRENAHVFLEIDTDEELISGGDVACAYGAAYASVMGRGTAAIVEDPGEKVRGLQLMMETQTGRAFPISEAMADTVCVIRVRCETFTAKSRPARGKGPAQAV